MNEVNLAQMAMDDDYEPQAQEVVDLASMAMDDSQTPSQAPERIDLASMAMEDAPIAEPVDDRAMPEYSLQEMQADRERDRVAREGISGQDLYKARNQVLRKQRIDTGIPEHVDVDVTGELIQAAKRAPFVIGESLTRMLKIIGGAASEVNMPMSSGVEGETSFLTDSQMQEKKEIKEDFTESFIKTAGEVQGYMKETKENIPYATELFKKKEQLEAISQLPMSDSVGAKFAMVEGLDSASRMLSYIASGAVSGAAGAALFMGLDIGTEDYELTKENLIQQGLPKEVAEMKARISGTLVGTFGALANSIGMNKMFSKAGMAAMKNAYVSVVRQLAKGTGWEVGTEVLEEGFSSVVKKTLDIENISLDDFIKRLERKAVASFPMAAGGSSLGSGRAYTGALINNAKITKKNIERNTKKAISKTGDVLTRAIDVVSEKTPEYAQVMGKAAGELKTRTVNKTTELVDMVEGSRELIDSAKEAIIEEVQVQRQKDSEVASEIYQQETSGLNKKTKALVNLQMVADAETRADERNKARNQKIQAIEELESVDKEEGISSAMVNHLSRELGVTAELMNLKKGTRGMVITLKENEKVPELMKILLSKKDLKQKKYLPNGRVQYVIDTEQVQKTFAHELGHIVDYMSPDMKKASYDKGTLLGKIAKIKDITDVLMAPDKKGIDAIRNTLLEDYSKQLPPESNPAEEQARMDVLMHMVEEDAREIQSKMTEDGTTQELIALSKAWRGSWDKDSKKQKEYRESHDELYADAFSALMMNPKLVKEMAPSFFFGVQSWAENNPALKALLKEVETMRNPENATNKIDQMLGKGIEESIDEFKGNNDEMRTAWEVISGVPTAVNDAFVEIMGTAINQAPKKYREEILAQFGRYRNIDNVFEMYIRDVREKIVEPLEKKGIERKDFDRLLLFNRLITDARLVSKHKVTQKSLIAMAKKLGYKLEADEAKVLKSKVINRDELTDIENDIVSQFDWEIADRFHNPYNLTYKQANDGIKKLQTDLGKENFNFLFNQAKEFHKLRKEYILNPLQESGTYEDSEVQHMLDNEFYSKIEITEKMRDKKKYKTRKGSIGSAGSPLYATVNNDMQMVKTTLLNNAKKSLIKALVDKGAGDMAVKGRVVKANITPEGTNFIQIPLQKGKNFSTIMSTKAETLLPDAVEKGEDVVTFRENGKDYAFIAPERLLRGINSLSHSEINTLNNVLGFMNKINSPFKKMWTELNPKFWMFNLPRDLKRSFLAADWAETLPYLKNIPVGLYEGLKEAYAPIMDSIPDKYRPPELRGKKYKGSETVQDMKRKMLIVPRLLSTPKHLQNIENKEQTKAKKVFNTVYDLYTGLNKGAELATKIAAYKTLMKQQRYSEDEIYNRITSEFGSPNFSAGGSLTKHANAALTFFNANVQGWRGELKAGKRNPMSYIPKALVWNGMSMIVKLAMLNGLIGTDEEERSWFQKIMRGVSIRDLIGFDIFPITYDEKTGESVYLRMPKTGLEKIISATFFWMTNPNVSAMEAGKNILDETGGEAPVSTSPSIGLIHDLWSLAFGTDLKDPFTGREVVSKTEKGASAEQRRLGQFWTEEMTVKANYIWKQYFSLFNDAAKANPERSHSVLDSLANGNLGRVTGGLLKYNAHGVAEKMIDTSQQITDAKSLVVLNSKKALDKALNQEQLTAKDKAHINQYSKNLTGLGMLKWVHDRSIKNLGTSAERAALGISKDGALAIKYNELKRSKKNIEGQRIIWDHLTEKAPTLIDTFLGERP